MPEASGTAPVRTLAVFIDADNLNDPTALDHALTELRQRTERVVYKRAYGSTVSLKGIEVVLSRHGVRPVANMVVNKVTTDSALVIDAVEAVCRNDIDAVAICSGDADFVPLAVWLREQGCRVWCYSLEGQLFANPESFYDDVVCIELVEPESAPEPAPPPPEPAAMPVVQPLVRPPVVAAASEVTAAQVVAAFPALADGQPQHLSQVVARLRQQGLLGKSGKTVAWFARFGTSFVLTPVDAPNHVRYAPTGKQRSAVIEKPIDSALLARLQRAVLAAQDASGWARVQSVRQQLGDKSAFDLRSHGFASMSKLLAACDAFELRGAGTPQVAVRAKQAMPAGAMPPENASTTGDVLD